VRIDILERIADLIRAALSWRPASETAPPPGAVDGRSFSVSEQMTSLAGCSGDDFAEILKALGYRSERRPAPAKVEAPKAEAAPATETANSEETASPAEATPEASEPVAEIAAEAPAETPIETPRPPRSRPIWRPSSRHLSPLKNPRRNRKSPRQAPSPLLNQPKRQTNRSLHPQ
jgi:hypothetical protein